MSACKMHTNTPTKAFFMLEEGPAWLFIPFRVFAEAWEEVQCQLPPFLLPLPPSS